MNRPIRREEPRMISSLILERSSLYPRQDPYHEITFLVFSAIIATQVQNLLLALVIVIRGGLMCNLALAV